MNMFRFKRINKVDVIMGNYLSGIIDSTTKDKILNSRRLKSLALEVENNWNNLVYLLNISDIKYKLSGYIEIVTKSLIYKVRVSSLGFMYQTVDSLGRESALDIVDTDNLTDFVQNIN